MLKYRILDSLFDGILAIDRDFKIVFANKTLLDICGLEKEKIIGKNCHEISHRCPSPCILTNSKCPHKEVFSKGSAVTVKHIHYCFNGEERIFEVIASPVLDEKGAVIEMVEILRDVTEKERTIEEIKTGREFLSNVLNSLGEAVMVIDKEFKILSANNRFLELAGESMDNVTGKYCFEISHRFDRPCNEKGEECCAKPAFETGKECSTLHTHYDKEGRTTHLEISAYPLKDSKGNITSVIEVMNNITQRVRLEEDLIDPKIVEIALKVL